MPHLQLGETACASTGRLGPVHPSLVSLGTAAAADGFFMKTLKALPSLGGQCMPVGGGVAYRVTTRWGCPAVPTAPPNPPAAVLHTRACGGWPLTALRSASVKAGPGQSPTWLRKAGHDASACPSPVCCHCRCWKKCPRVLRSCHERPHVPLRKHGPSASGVGEEHFKYFVEPLTAAESRQELHERGTGLLPVTSLQVAKNAAATQQSPMLQAECDRMHGGMKGQVERTN